MYTSRIRPSSRSRRESVIARRMPGVAPEPRQLDVRFTAQRTARLAVRPALAEQRGARDRIALLGQRMKLRALHCGAAG